MVNRLGILTSSLLNNVMAILIADSGSTKCEWCLLHDGRKKIIFTQGMSPYFLTSEQVQDIMRTELQPKIKNQVITDIYFYGTGCLDPRNAKMMKASISKVFPGVKVQVEHDL